MNTKRRFRCPACKFDKTYAGDVCDECTAAGVKLRKTKARLGVVASRREVGLLITILYAFKTDYMNVPSRNDERRFATALLKRLEKDRS